MGKTRKNIHTMTVPNQYYYPTMLVPYIPPKRTKKRSIKDFKYTYGHNFKPNEFLKPPKTRIVFNKKDDIYQFTKNTLSLYNIDYNPSFVDFSMNNFKAKIKEYLNHYKNKNLYIDSVNSIRKSSDLVELEKVLNEHELHLILEAIDTMFEYANFKNFKIKGDLTEQRKMHDFIMRGDNYKILQDKMTGGGNIKKFDIINYVNGNKRKQIKERIIKMIYIDFDNEDTMGYVYDGDFPSDYEMSIKERKSTVTNDEIMDTCFDSFIQQKVFTHLGFKEKDSNPYFRGEFQKNLKGCKEKNYYNPDFFEDKLPPWAYKVPGSKNPKAFEKNPKNDDFEGLDDKFEFAQGRSMINIDYLNFIKNNKEKMEELKELIEVYHKLQIPDTRFARNKEKMMKEYLSSLSMAIIMLGMLPPTFFGEDHDFNPFDVLSTVMCIFEGSTVCAVMSALPLFSPFLDMLSTFSIVRKILNKFGVTGAVGKRSQAAIKKAQQRKIAKQNAFMEKGVKLKADLATMSRNMDKATGLQKAQLKKKFDKLKEANLNYAKQSEKMAKKGVQEAMKRAKAQSKGAEKLVKQLSSGAKKAEDLTAAEKAKLQRYSELLNMEKKTAKIKGVGTGVKDADSKLKSLKGALGKSKDADKILKNGEKAATQTVLQLKLAQSDVTGIKNIKTPEAAASKFGKYEVEMANINKNRDMVASGVDSQGVKLSQQKLDSLNAEIKKSMDGISPKHLVESRNYAEKQLKYLQSGTAPPVDKMARYEQSFKPSSDASVAQMKKHHARMSKTHQARMAKRAQQKAAKKPTTGEAEKLSDKVKKFKETTSEAASEIRVLEKQLKVNEGLLKGRLNSTNKYRKWRGKTTGRTRKRLEREKTSLQAKITEKKEAFSKTLEKEFKEIGKATKQMGKSTQKIINNATDAIVAKRMKQAGLEDEIFIRSDGYGYVHAPDFVTTGGKTLFTRTLKSSKADKAKVRRALRGKQLKASEDSLKAAKIKKAEATRLKKKVDEAFSQLDDTAREALKKGDLTQIKALEDLDPNKIREIKVLQAQFKAAEAQSKYAAAVARKNFDKVITGQTKKRFYDFRTWGKEGRTKKLNNFKEAQIDPSTVGEQMDLMKGIDDVVTPGLTRVKNKDLKYFKTQAEVAKQEAGLANATAKKETFLKKIADEKDAALKKWEEGAMPPPKILEAQADAARNSLLQFQQVQKNTQKAREFEITKQKILRDEQVLKKLTQRKNKMTDGTAKKNLEKEIKNVESKINKSYEKINQNTHNVLTKKRFGWKGQDSIDEVNRLRGKRTTGNIITPKEAKNLKKLEKKMLDIARKDARKQVKIANKEVKVNMDEVGLNFNQMKDFGNIEKNMNAAKLKVKIADKGAKNIFRSKYSYKNFKKSRLEGRLRVEQEKLGKRLSEIDKKHSKAQAEIKKYDSQLKDLKNELEISRRGSTSTNTINNIIVAEKQLRDDALQTSISVLEKKKNLAQARIAQRQQEFLEAAQGSSSLNPFRKFKRTEKGFRKAKKTAKNELSKMFKDKGVKSRKTFEKGLEKLDKSIKKQKEIKKDLEFLRKVDPPDLRRIELLESNLAFELARTNQNFKRIQSGSKKLFGETFYPKSFEKKIKEATRLEFDKVTDMSVELQRLEKRVMKIGGKHGLNSEQANRAVLEYHNQLNALNKQKKLVQNVKKTQFGETALLKAKNRLDKSQKALEKELRSALKKGEDLLKDENLNVKFRELLKNALKDTNPDLSWKTFFSAGVKAEGGLGSGIYGMRAALPATMLTGFSSGLGAMIGGLAGSAAIGSGVGAGAVVGVIAAYSLTSAKLAKKANASMWAKKLLKNKEFLKDVIQHSGINKAKFSRLVNAVDDVNTNIKVVEGQINSLVKVANNLPPKTAQNVLGKKTFQEIAEAKGKAPPPPINISKGAEQTAAAEKATKEAAEKSRLADEAAEKSRLARETAKDAAAKKRGLEAQLEAARGKTVTKGLETTPDYKKYDKEYEKLIKSTDWKNLQRRRPDLDFTNYSGNFEQQQKQLKEIFDASITYKRQKGTIGALQPDVAGRASKFIPDPIDLGLGFDGLRLRGKSLSELKPTSVAKVADGADTAAIAKLKGEVVTATAEAAEKARLADTAAEQARLAAEAAKQKKLAAEAADAAAEQKILADAAAEQKILADAAAEQKILADAAEKSSEAAKQAAKAAEAGKNALRNAKILDSGSDLDRTELFFKNKLAIESGEAASKSMKKIDAQIELTERNIRLVGDGKEAAALNERLLRLKGEKELLSYDIEKAKKLQQTKAERFMDDAIEGVDSKLQFFKLQEEVKPVVPPLERLQQFLDNLADAYLVKYNIEEEYQHIQDIEFDKQCSETNNKLLENIWSKNGQDALYKFGTVLGGSIGDMGGVFTALQAFQKQSRFLQSFELTDEEKEKKIEELRYGKHKKGISDREKERRINYGPQIAEESFLRKRGKKKNNKLTPKEESELENAKLDASIKSDLLSYEELDDVMDTHTEDFLDDEGFNQKKMSEVDELMREDLGKKTYQLRNTQSEKVKQAMDEKLDEKRAIREYTERKRLEENEEEQNTLSNDNERKILQPGESKLVSKPLKRIEGHSLAQSNSNIRFTPTRNNSNQVKGDEINTIGGGKKKEPELTLRNEVMNDRQLRRELDKFSEDYKGYMAEFNRPLEALMKRRSDYKIKQKLSLKENFLKIYRDTKSEAFVEVEDIKKLEFTTFEQQNNYYTKQKKQLFKAISSTGGNAFMILNIQLGTFNKGNDLINEIEKLEVKMNKMIEDKEISEFIRNFDKILEKIGKKEIEIKKIKKDIQEFKAKDADLDKLLKELDVLEKERKNYKADTNKKKTYTKMASKLRILAKELSESKEFINLYEKFKKKKMSFDVFRKNKKGQFDSLKKMLIEEIKYIKNEYDIAKFFSLGLSGIKKLTLVEVLQSIYLDIFKVRKSFEVINEFYEEENPKINKEIKSGEEQINFYYRTREKILLKEDKELFEKRYTNRRNNLKLLKELQVNLVNDHADNLNIIDKCNDLLFYCDFNINNIKNINIIQETKTKILTDQYGLIDINELHEKQLDRSINLTYKELSDILDDILSYRKIINSSRKKLHKSITNKHTKKGKLTKSFLAEKEKEKADSEKKKEVQDQLKTVDKRLMDYEGINIDYMNFEKPIDLLTFYKILESEINIDGKMEYSFNKLVCEMKNIKIDIKLEEKLNAINSFINTHEIV